MFAYQVIEDLNNGMKIFDDFGFFKGTPLVSTTGTIEAIKSAQKFHFGEWKQIEHLSFGMIGQHAFLEKDDFKIPYRVTWFDYRFSNIDSERTIPNHLNEEEKEKLKHFLESKPQCVSSKRGILALDLSYIENEQLYYMAIFNYMDRVQNHEPHWEPSPVSAFITPGIPIGDTKYYEKINKITPYARSLRGEACIPVINAGDRIIRNFDDVNFYTLENVDEITALGVMLKLLNCKNVQPEIIKAPEALNKKRRKNGKQEIFDYHVLNVVVPGKKRGYHEAIEPLSHNRVHLCRGHFKEYTAEHPLFGKYTGLYWWQPHIHGQNKDGIAIKDYNVRAEVA